MPLIRCSEIDPSDMKPCRRPDAVYRRRCTVCGNTHPKWLFIDSYGDVAGCDDCLCVEYIGEPPEC